MIAAKERQGRKKVEEGACRGGKDRERKAAGSRQNPTQTGSSPGLRQLGVKNERFTAFGSSKRRSGHAGPHLHAVQASQATAQGPEAHAEAVVRAVESLAAHAVDAAYAVDAVDA